MGWDTVWAIFFTNSSGHPDYLSGMHPFNVTRLGEFSPFGSQFTVGSFLKIIKVSHTFGLFFLSTVEVIH
jgi:hypothetical protein